MWNGDHELVAAEPGHDVFRAGVGVERGRGVAQNLIAREVSVRIVDVFEAVEVEQYDVHDHAFGEKPLRLGDEEAAIERAGEIVPGGQTVEVANGDVHRALPRRETPAGR